MTGLTQDTQAVLLLCAGLGQRDDNGAKPLNVRQYSLLAGWLSENSLRPADLLRAEGRTRLEEWRMAEVSLETLERLLDRGTALGLVLERWAGGGRWVVSRADQDYPERLKSYLGQKAPPLLYGVGERGLLDARALAIVGSRDAAEEDLEFAREVASACARERLAVVSGGAKGIDSEAMMAAVDSGGRAIGVLAEGLGRAAVASKYHDALLDGRMTLVSPYEPEARWFAYTAMERNKVIYALSEAALVVCSAAEEGGTWAGAVEALKHGGIPVYVKSSGVVAPGNQRLLQSGARPLPPQPWENLTSLFERAPSEPLLFESTTVKEEAVQPEAAPAESTDLFPRVLPVIIAVLHEAKNERAFSEALGIVPAQAKAWLKRALAEGHVRKLGRPARWVAAQRSLFGNPS